MRDRSPSPLRYPGGKASLAGVLETIIYANRLQGCTYVEPFAGGAGAGIKLLMEGHVDRIVINDVDKAVFSFWDSVMEETEELVERVHSIPLSVEEWGRQKEIYVSPTYRSRLDLGFAAFYLNRCNRSGIIKNGGPIGGKSQKGEWKIGARFNRESLARRIEEIAEFGDRVIVLRVDARSLIENLVKYIGDDPCFVYSDPPYYLKGRELYFSHYSDADHAALAETMQNSERTWVMTYDRSAYIEKLYGEMNLLPFSLRYSAHKDSPEGAEILISPPNVVIPRPVRDLLSKSGGFFRAAPL